MISVLEFVFGALGTPLTMEVAPIYYILAAFILLVFIDGIIAFILGGINSLTMRGK